MTATAPLSTTWRRRAEGTLASARAAGWGHGVTLILGALVLLYAGRGQWFYFDEWDFMWQPEALRRLVEGHNGHWSLIPIAIWLALENTLGLGSYLPYLALAFAAHLVLAHLLWRLLRRVRCQPWISTFLIAVFIFLGTATENLMWAFQFGYMGAIAFAIGALLIVARDRLSVPGALGAAALLTLGAATSGTALPFFAAVLVVVLFTHGWRRALLVIGPPAVIYLVWYTLVAGDNPTAIYRATGIGNSLQGIPQFMARMWVDGLTTVTPVPSFGLVIVTAIAIWVLARVRRPPSKAELIAYGMLVSGILFAALTAYSRLAVGPGGGTAPRYAYLIVVAVLPAVSIILTYVVGASRRALLAVCALIAVVLVHNVGALISIAYADSDRERTTHALISAAAALADEYPDAVDLDARPDPRLVPRTLGELLILEREDGLERAPFSQSESLTALLNVATSLTPGPTSDPDCRTPLQAGNEIAASPEGLVLIAEPGTRLTMAAAEGTVTSANGEFVLEDRSTRLTTPYEVRFVIRESTAPVFACGNEERR